jgi:ligand-binding sensor domain-containing protein
MRIIAAAITIAAFLLVGCELDETKKDGEEWKTYPGAERVNALAVDEASVWLGASGDGLLRMDKETGQKYQYNKENSGLPNLEVTALAIDDSNRIWVGTWGGGVAMFDREKWTVYNMVNSGVPEDHIRAIAVKGRDVYIGTDERGIVKYDGIAWTRYVAAGADIVSDETRGLAFDREGNLWATFATEGVSKFLGATWLTDRGALPFANIGALTFDEENRLWIGNENGLYFYNGEQWNAYRSEKTDVPTKRIEALTVDDSGMVWAGTWQDGVVAFRSGL